MSRESVAVASVAAIASFLLGLVAASTRPVMPTTVMAVRPATLAARPLTVERVEATPADTSGGTAVDFASVAARLNAAVVNVDAASRGTESRPVRRWSRDFGDDSGTPREGSGSGFIIDAAGYVLTNYHVVEGADRITISLSDGRAFRAEVVGVDAAIDVALLRIESRDPLPVAPLGDSNTLEVGEWVCAIGNPLGYVHSVTVGVVSFLGRKLFDQSLDAFIQTDAAIAFGNSGGPLINARGEVVGMTTAISAQASNIGFAIPIAQIESILPQLHAHGRVSRGYIGVGLTSVTPVLSRALRLTPEQGALVQDVTRGHPGERAGLRPYDVIVGVNGAAITSDEDLIRLISGLRPGTLASLDLWRDGGRRTVPVKLTERPVTDPGRGGDLQVRPAVGHEYGPMGLLVRDLDEASATRNRIPVGVRGVMVSFVDPAGPARLARLRAGQVIIEVNRTPTTSAAQFQSLVNALAPGDPVAVLLYDPPPSDQRLIATIRPDFRP